MKEQEKIFNEYSVWKAMAAMALPAVIMMIVMVIYNMADMFFIAQLKNTAMVASVSIVGPVFAMVMAVGNMIGSGGCTVIARTLGERNDEMLKKYSSLCGWGCIAAGLLCTVILLVFEDQLLGFLGANEETWSYASSYLRILALGAPFMVFSAGFGNLLRAVGDVKNGMMANFLGTIVNIVLDPILILVFHMGTAGAALATVIGYASGCLLEVTRVLKKDCPLTLSPVYAKDVRPLGKVLYSGLPNLASTFLSSFASAFANRMLVGYGTTAVAAMAAAGKAGMLITMIQMGLAVGVQPLMAYAYGAGDERKLKESCEESCGSDADHRFCIDSRMAISTSEAIVGMFLKEAEAADLSVKMMRLMVLAGPLSGMTYIASNLLQACDKVTVSTVISVLRQGLMLVPLLYIMNRLQGMMGNVYAHLFADLGSALLSLIVTVYCLKKLYGKKEAVSGKVLV